MRLAVGYDGAAAVFGARGVPFAAAVYFDTHALGDPVTLVDPTRRRSFNIDYLG